MHSDRLAGHREKQTCHETATGVTHPKVGPRHLLRVETEIYCLVSGPSWLRASLTVDMLAAGYVKNPYDKCLFTLISSDETSEGQLLLDVDDFMEGGKEAHCKTMDGFHDKYRCGKAVDLMSAGQEVHGLLGDVSCKTPISASLCRWTNMSKGYLSNIKEMSDGMLTNIKGVNGGLGLVGVNSKTRHGGASLDHSIWV